MKKESMFTRSFSEPVKASEDGKEISGYAIVFDQPSREFMDDVYEVIDRRALDNADLRNMIAVNNHNLAEVLATLPARNLEYKVDDHGLWYRAFDLRDTTYVRDLLVNVRSGLVTGNSFRFAIKDEDDSVRVSQIGNKTEIRVMKIRMVVEVGPTALPAYQGTNLDEQRSLLSMGVNLEAETKKRVELFNNKIRK